MTNKPLFLFIFLGYNFNSMPLGRGLSSLIPPKEESEKKENFEEVLVNNNSSKLVTNLVDKENQESEGVYGLERERKQSRREEAVFQIEIEKIVSNPYQPRKDFDEKSLLELAESIKHFGILQPLVVTKVVKEKEGGVDVEYHLIAGERRLKAAKLVGLERVPAIVKNVEKPGHRLEMALIENIQRSDLNPIEEAKAYARLQDEFGLTQREIATRVGKSREAIANSLRLLNLSEEMQQALIDKKITESQARMLLSLPDTAERENIFQNILKNKLSVRDLQSVIAGQKNSSLQEKVTNKILENKTSPELLFFQKELENKLNLPVKINGSAKRGKIVIDFFSLEDLHNLIDRLGGLEN